MNQDIRAMVRAGQRRKMEEIFPPTECSAKNDSEKYTDTLFKVATTLLIINGILLLTTSIVTLLG